MNVENLPPNMKSKIALELPPVSHVDGTCWTWQNCINSKGYGCVQHDGKRQLVHRVAYTLLVGPIPDGLQIDHLCLNRRCCNPHHLEPVTGAVNVGRAAAATKSRCKHGHPLAGPNVRIKSKGQAGSQRQCRACEMDNSLAQTQRNSTGQRQPSASSARKREERRAWLLSAGEAALEKESAGIPFAAERTAQQRPA